MPHPLGSPALHSKASEAYNDFLPKLFVEDRHCGVNLRRQPAWACHIGFTDGTTAYREVGSGAGRDEEAAKTQLVLPSSEHGAAIRLPPVRSDYASGLAGRSAEIRGDWRSESRSHRTRAEEREAAPAATETEHSDRQAVTDALLAGALMLVALAWAASTVLL